MPFVLVRCHQYLKDTIWKQFTTLGKEDSPVFRVSPIPQRYNLKAIHNVFIGIIILRYGVTNTSKIQSESNSQRTMNLTSESIRCHQYLKDTIWKQFTTSQPEQSQSYGVSPIPQRYNLKAIHNCPGPCLNTLTGVTNTSKIQSESNSQRLKYSCPLANRCHQYLKDTIWKQFTTRRRILRLRNWCHQYLKDTIWKQFTTVRTLSTILPWVSPIPQRYNLKAIHNVGAFVYIRFSGVTNTSKIQSESNSQRVNVSLVTLARVSPIPQRYNLKAIHNRLKNLLKYPAGVTNTSKIQSESNSQR